MIAIAGATGQLGRLVVKNLLDEVPANDIVALVRNPAKAAAFEEAGIQLRQADYNRPETLAPALAGVEKLLLISSSEVGSRARQHGAVIEAAQQAGVKLIAYTSLLHADSTPLALAAEHKETEEMLKASGIPHVLLRNGWYTENYLATIPPALQHGIMIGCAGAGRFSTATREDYAVAAVAVLTKEDQAGRVYELAGDDAWTLTDFCAELARQSGTAIVYQNLARADYEAALVQAGVPAAMASVLSDCELGASAGALFDDSRQLSQLIGRPTTPLAVSIAGALQP